MLNRFLAQLVILTILLLSTGCSSSLAPEVPEGQFYHFEIIVESSGQVRVEIENSYSQVIRQLRDTLMEAGSYIVEWDANDDAGVPVTQGVYFVHTITGTTETRTLLLTVD